MSNNIKKLIKMLSATAFLFVFMFVFSMPAFAANSGSCGPNTTFAYENGTLTISGDGGMKDYGSVSDTPWYKYRNEITAIVITDGVTGVGNLAFYGMENLYSVTLPSSLQAIGNYSFSNCEKLAVITLPENLRSIGQRSFERCSSLTAIKIPSKVKSIGSGAFYRCYGLSAIILPKSIESIGDSVFAYCTGLVTATIKYNLDTVPLWMFYGCNSLTDISFASNVKNIGENALAGCDSLTSITYDEIRQNVEEIKNNSTTEISDVQQEQNTPPAAPAPSATQIPVTTPAPEGQKDVTATEDAVITVTKPLTEEAPPVVDVVIENKSGLKDALNTLDKIQETYNNMTVNIQLKDTNILDKSVLKKFAEKDVILNVTTLQNSLWVFDCKEIPSKKIKDLDLSVSLIQKIELTEKEKAEFGDSILYKLSFKNDFSYSAEVRIPVGTGYARQYATLYLVDDVVTKNLQSVLIDNYGHASFAFSADSAGEGYILAMNLQGHNTHQNAYIPQHMQREYTGLVDEYGTRYVVTGRTSSTGLELDEFIRYVAVGFIAIVILVGSMVFVITKQRQIKEQYKNK